MRAADFHVTDGSEFQDALDVAAANGVDDTIYMAAGVYDRFVGFPVAGFTYVSTVSQSLTIMPDSGVAPGEVILFGHDQGYVLQIHDTQLHDRVRQINVAGLMITRGFDEHQAALDIQADDYDVTVSGCSIVFNQSNSGRGGGVSIGCFGNLLFENNLVAHNQVYERMLRTSAGPYLSSEGAGAQIRCYGDLAVLRNNVFAYNDAEGEQSYGGGMNYGGTCYQVASLINNTFYANFADFGGGFFASLFGTGPVLNIYNNIIHSNLSTNPYARDFYTLGFSDAQISAFNNNYSSALSVLDDSGDNVDFDPEFIDPLTLDFRLLPSSPLVDLGTVGPPAPGLPDWDFDGEPRICGDGVDIGADEYCGDGSVPVVLPVPRILINGETSAAIVRRSDAFWLTAELSPAGYQGEVEWWIGLEDSRGNVQYVTPNGWSNDPVPYYYGPAEEIQAAVKIEPRPMRLRKGQYRLLTAADTLPDGQLSNVALYDEAIVFYAVKRNGSDHLRPYWRWDQNSEPMLVD